MFSRREFLGYAGLAAVSAVVGEDVSGAVAKRRSGRGFDFLMVVFGLSVRPNEVKTR